MRNGICLALLLLMITGSVALAQNSKVVSTYNYLKYYDRDKSDKSALENAKEAIDEAAEHETTSQKGKTWYYRGLVYYNLAMDTVLSEQYPDALYESVESYKKAVSVNDDKFKDAEDIYKNLRISALLLHNSGVESFRSNDFAGAYKDFTTIIDINKFLDQYKAQQEIDVDAARLNAALAAERINKPAEAKRLYEDLININYDNPGIYQSLANLYKSEKDTAKALEILKGGIEKHPDNIGLYIDELNIYLQSGRQAEAIGRLEQAIKLDTSNAQLYYALGVAYDSQGNQAKAVEAYKNAIRINPEYFDVYNNLGALYYNQAVEINKQINELPLSAQKKYDELTKQRNDLYVKALPYFERAAELDPDNLSMLNALKEIYAKMGEYEKSKQIKVRIETLKGG